MKTFKKLPLILLTMTLLNACSFLPKATRNIASENQEIVKESIQSTANYLKVRQLPDHSFAGAFVSDIAQEAIFLTLGKKIKLLTPDLEKEIIKVMFLRMESDGLGWSAYPGGQADHGVTGFALKALEFAGIKSNDERVKKAWEHYLNSGGDKKLNAVVKLQMGVLGLLPAKDSVPPVPPQLINLNYKYGMKKLGIHGLLLYPLVGTRILQKIEDGAWSNYSKNTDEYLSMPLTLGENYKQKDFYTNRSSVDIAKLSVAYSLQMRGETKGWYGVLFSACHLLFLNEANRTGLGNFDSEIKSAWAAMNGWITKSEEGFLVIQPSKSDVWDTASTMNAINALPSEFDGEKQELNSNEATEWLLAKTIYFKDARSSAVWSFDSTDKMLPDLDDTAAVMHALATSPVKNDEKVKALLRTSVDWVLERQNKDGGFPAWSKGVSKSLFGLLEKIGDLPKMADISQSDVSSRVLHMLHVVAPLDIVDANKLAKAKQSACRFFEKSAEDVSNIPTRTFVGHWVSNYTYATSHLIKGLIYAECPNSKAWIKELATWLMAVQQKDGGWGENNSSYKKEKYIPASSTISQSALTLVGLIETYEYLKNQNDPDAQKVKDSIEKGVTFLMAKSKNGTNFFEKEFTAIMIKGALYARYELLNAYSTLYVLGRWYEMN